MGEAGGETKYPSWRWVVGIAVMFIFFLVSRGFDISTAKDIAQSTAYKELQAGQQTISERVTRLETNFDYIARGIDELRAGQKDVTAALNAHEKSSRARQ